MTGKPTLDEWVGHAGFVGLREEIFTHAQTMLSDREADELTRLVMISLRQETEKRPLDLGRLAQLRGQLQCARADARQFQRTVWRLQREKDRLLDALVELTAPVTAKSSTS